MNLIGAIVIYVGIFVLVLLNSFVWGHATDICNTSKYWWLWNIEEVSNFLLGFYTIFGTIAICIYAIIWGLSQL